MVLGVDDPHRYGCTDLGSALANVPGHAFKSCLLTRRRYAARPRWRAFISTYVDTHAGQIRLPGIGALLCSVYPLCTSNWRFERFERFCRFVKSVSCVESKELLGSNPSPSATPKLCSSS